MFIKGNKIRLPLLCASLLCGENWSLGHSCAGADERSRRSGAKPERDVYQEARAAHTLHEWSQANAPLWHPQWQSPAPIKSLDVHARAAGSGWPLDAGALWPTGARSHLYAFCILACDIGAVALNFNWADAIILTSVDEITQAEPGE